MAWRGVSWHGGGVSVSAKITASKHLYENAGCCSRSWRKPLRHVTYSSGEVLIASAARASLATPGHYRILTCCTRLANASLPQLAISGGRACAQQADMLPRALHAIAQQQGAKATSAH